MAVCKMANHLSVPPNGKKVPMGIGHLRLCLLWYSRFLLGDRLDRLARKAECNDDRMSTASTAVFSHSISDLGGRISKSNITLIDVKTIFCVNFCGGGSNVSDTPRAEYCFLQKSKYIDSKAEGIAAVIPVRKAFGSTKTVIAKPAPNLIVLFTSSLCLR